MFDINFTTDDGTKYKLRISAVYFEGDEPGMEMEIVEINTAPLGFHFREIFDAWNYHAEVYDNAVDRAYLELEER